MSKILTMDAPDWDRRAIVLYAVLARDPMDFMDMLADEDPQCLQILYKMLTCKQPDKDTDHELNEIGAGVVARHCEGRDIELEAWTPADG
jgi:hypothetical protein